MIKASALPAAQEARKVAHASLAYYRQMTTVIARSVTESRPGAAIKVDRIELTEAGRAMLTVKGSP